VETAKVFWSGRSQAVRLPKRFRLEAREVRIRKRGNEIVLEPLPDTWAWLDAIAGTLDEDFVEAVQEQPQATEERDLTKLFGA
jgi:antitoxin VapB